MDQGEELPSITLVRNMDLAHITLPHHAKHTGYKQNQTTCTLRSIYAIPQHYKAKNWRTEPRTSRIPAMSPILHD